MRPTPAEGLLRLLSLGTWPGSIARGQLGLPNAPYDGPAPAIFVGSLPVSGQVVWEAAGTHRLDGTLELLVLDRAPEHGRTLEQADREMLHNVQAICTRILADLTLEGTVVMVESPLTVARVHEGPFAPWSGPPWLGAVVHVPYIGVPMRDPTS